MRLMQLIVLSTPDSTQPAIDASSSASSFICTSAAPTRQASAMLELKVYIQKVEGHEQKAETAYYRPFS